MIQVSAFSNHLIASCIQANQALLGIAEHSDHRFVGLLLKRISAHFGNHNYPKTKEEYILA